MKKDLSNNVWKVSNEKDTKRIVRKAEYPLRVTAKAQKERRKTFAFFSLEITQLGGVKRSENRLGHLPLGIGSSSARYTNIDEGGHLTMVPPAHGMHDLMGKDTCHLVLDAAAHGMHNSMGKDT